jgi:hypothetical protein
MTLKLLFLNTTSRDQNHVSNDIEKNEPKSFRVFLFTCRDATTDFRIPLVDALRDNYATYYIRLRKRPIITGPRKSDQFTETSLYKLFTFISSFRNDNKVNIYFVSTNTSFTLLLTLMRLLLPRGIWCIDMHDDLLYNYKRIGRLVAALNIMIMQCISDVTIIAAPKLSELFPRSCRLGNASHIKYLNRETNIINKVLVIASVDDRFDFCLLNEIATKCPTIVFDIYGSVSTNRASFLADFVSLCGRHKNICYHGPYDMADLPMLLGAYSVSFAPYRTGIRLTRYIDPLRFYHCLNSGMEVITTDIPQASFMKDVLHIVSNADEFADVISRLNCFIGHKRDHYKPITWEQRADQLVNIICRLPKMRT